MASNPITRLRDQMGDEAADQWLTDQLGKFSQGYESLSSFLQQATQHSQKEATLNAFKQSIGEGDDGLKEDVKEIRGFVRGRLKRENPRASKDEIERHAIQMEERFMQDIMMQGADGNPMAIAPRRQLAAFADELRHNSGRMPYYSNPNLYGEVKTPHPNDIPDGAPGRSEFDDARDELIEATSGGRSRSVMPKRDKYADGVDTSDPWE